MRRELLIAVGVAMILGSGVTGCSKDSKDDESSGTSSAATTTSSATTASSPATTSAAAPATAGAAKVTVGGQPQNVSGPVVCSTTDGKFSIAIGEVITGVIVGLEPDASVVHNVGLGTVNGVVLSFTEGVPGNNATATKDGNTYKITGTATGVDSANAGQEVSKPFEIEATCP